MMVRMSLPLAVLRSKIRPVCARTLTFLLWRLSRVVANARPHRGQVRPISGDPVLHLFLVAGLPYCAS
jgi:hypothetical protein